MSRSKSVAATPSTAAPAGCGSAPDVAKAPLLSAFRQLRQLRQGYLMDCKWWSPVPQVGIFIQGVCSRPRRPCRPCRFPTLSIGLERQAGPGHRSRAAVTCALLCTQPPHPKRGTYPCPIMQPTACHPSRTNEHWPCRGRQSWRSLPTTPLHAVAAAAFPGEVLAANLLSRLGRLTGYGHPHQCTLTEHAHHTIACLASALPIPRLAIEASLARRCFRPSRATHRPGQRSLASGCDGEVQ